MFVCSVNCQLVHKHITFKILLLTLYKIVNRNVHNFNVEFITLYDDQIGVINPFIKLELVSLHTKAQASTLQTFVDDFVDCI